ncbi:MAG: MarR family winged helix-turn-helix transcriptional regulator [Acidimicrobiia bacterium]
MQLSISLPKMPSITTADVERLERALGGLFRKSGRLHSVLAARAGETCDRVGYLVLKAVAAGESVRVSDLARDLGVEVPTMSRHVANLNAGGYLRKTPDSNDGRVTWVELTDRGHATVSALESQRRLVLSRVFAGWSSADRNTFVDLLERFSNELADQAVPIN